MGHSMTTRQKQLLAYILQWYAYDNNIPCTMVELTPRPTETEIVNLLAMFQEYGCTLYPEALPGICALLPGNLDDCMFAKGLNSPHECPHWKLVQIQ
jgi:hypothetical protein